ncbi:phage tail protein, partial [Lacticaseibacillus rhamnosus]
MANLIFGGHKIGSSSLQFSAARGVFSEVENTTQSVGASDGEMLIRSRLKSRIIPVTYDFVALSRREFERQLAPLLYSSGVQKLIIDDRPDEFWFAKVDGKIDMDRAYFLGTGTINFLVPDGIAHSVATKTFDNMPYKNVPVNFAIASHASGSNTTSKDAYPIHMQLSEDLSGKTITTVAKVIVTNYQGKVDSTNSIGPYIDVKDGPSTGAWSGLINQIPITGNGVYTLGPKTMTKHPLTGTTNQIDVEMYNLNATIEVWVKVELGTTASPWS